MIRKEKISRPDLFSFKTGEIRSYELASAKAAANARSELSKLSKYDYRFTATINGNKITIMRVDDTV